MATLEFKFDIHSLVYNRVMGRHCAMMVLGRYTYESKDASDLYCHENIYRCRNDDGRILDLSEAELENYSESEIDDNF